MDTAKLFVNGRSQAVRLPAAYRFEGAEVQIEKQGDTVLLRPLNQTMKSAMDAFFEAGPPLPDEFLDQRNDAAPEDREW